MSATPSIPPYKSTPVFDEHTLPAGLRKEHRTKPGVWGVIRVLDGRLRYRVLDPVSERILDSEHPGLVLPDQPHFVENPRSDADAGRVLRPLIRTLEWVAGD